MEIDFLGLNSPRNTMEQRFEHPLSDSDKGVIETSLSLRSSSSFDCQTKILNFPEKNKSSTYCNPSKTEQPSPVHAPTRPVFLYDLNDSPTGMRYTYLKGIVSAEIPSDAASLNMMYSAGRPNAFADTLQEKADKAVYGISSEARICINGHIPTVAMARKATLARFLEKRLHRLNQTRASHLMGKQLNPTNFDGSPTAITRSNKKRAANSLIQ